MGSIKIPPHPLRPCTRAACRSGFLPRSGVSLILRVILPQGQAKARDPVRPAGCPAALFACAVLRCRCLSLPIPRLYLSRLVGVALAPCSVVCVQLLAVLLRILSALLVQRFTVRASVCSYVLVVLLPCFFALHSFITFLSCYMQTVRPLACRSFLSCVPCVLWRFLCPAAVPCRPPFVPPLAQGLFRLR